MEYKVYRKFYFPRFAMLLIGLLFAYFLLFVINGIG